MPFFTFLCKFFDLLTKNAKMSVKNVSVINLKCQKTDSCKWNRILLI